MARPRLVNQCILSEPDNNQKERKLSYVELQVSSKAEKIAPLNNNLSNVTIKAIKTSYASRKKYLIA